MEFMDSRKRRRLARRDLRVDKAQAARQAQFHLFGMVGARARGVKGWERTRMGAQPVLIYDLSGIPLFYDFPVRVGRAQAGFIRTAAHQMLGDPVVSTQTIAPGWDVDAAKGQLDRLLEEKYPEYRRRTVRLVCYSYPKLALGADLISPRGDARTVLMDVADYGEISPEPRAPEEEIGQVPYSLLDAIPEEREAEGPELWNRVSTSVDEVYRREPRLDPSYVYRLPIQERQRFLEQSFAELQVIKLYTERVLDFCCHTGDCKDHECFCLHPQENEVHCARASGQMMLCFWRYCFSQVQIADAFNAPVTSGTSPSEIAPGLEALTNDCFDATRHNVATWTNCEDEIKARRPFMSCVPRHARACAGTKKWNIWIAGTPQPRYLYIFDPWPPNVGAVYWENFNATTYSTDYGMYTLKRRTTNHV